MTPPPMTSRRFGTVCEAHGLLGADDLLSVELERRDLDRRGAGRDDDRLRRLDRLGATFVGLHFDGARSRDARVAHHELDAVALEEAADAAGQLLDDAALPLLHLEDVHADTVRHDAHRRAVVLHLLVGVAGADERLRRHAAPVEADAADLLFFNADDFLLQLAETDRTAVAAGAAADHHHIAGSLRHNWVTPGTRR